MDWRAYWEAFPGKFGEHEFCRQVGRTARGGVPTGPDELARLMTQLVDGLALGPDDVLLDLCCGNGLLTRALAARCAVAAGVDFSSAMIELARRHHAGPGVTYLQGSVLDLQPALFGDTPAFDKVVMVESLQYFTPEALPALLDGIRRVSAPQVTVLFSGVLDRDRIWSFFDTPERRASYEQQRREGREVMGRWWSSDEVVAVARAHGFTCELLPQDPALNTAHYRFDARLTTT